MLKRRFPCLALHLRTKIPTTLAIIVEADISRNIALELNDNVLDVELDIPLDQDRVLFINNIASIAWIGLVSILNRY